MLRYMRRHKQSLLVKGVLGVIILVFIGWGVGSFEAARQTASVAVVNDESISYTELAQAEQNLTRAYRELYGAAYSPELVRQLDLQGRALDDLITAALLIGQAKKLGLQVTAEEVADSIRSTPMFSSNGRFDKRIYLRFLRFAQLSEEQFADQQRKLLLTRKVENLVTDGAVVSDAELRERYVVENQKVNLSYVKLSWEKLRETVTLTDKDLTEYYEQNSERYKEPERVEFSYVAYRPDDFKDSTTVTEDDVTQFYERHVTESFTDPPQVQLRQIVLDIPPDASEEERRQIRKRAEDIAEQATDSDFAALARKYSDHKPSAEKGGDVGWVGRAELQPALADAAFALEKGAVSKPVELPTAIYLLQAQDTRGSRPRPLDEVRAEIETTIREEKARGLARAAADEDAAGVAGGATLEEVASAREFDVHQSKPLKVGDFDPEFGPTGPIVDAALRLKPGETSDVIETPRGLFLIRLTERRPASILPFDQARARVEMDLRTQRAKAAVETKAEALFKELQETRDLAALAAREGLTVEQTGLFGRSGQAISRLGLGNELPEDAFTLSPAGST
jgi:peptidyl-prolyl cis-trans isomerase D